MAKPTPVLCAGRTTAWISKAFLLLNKRRWPPFSSIQPRLSCKTNRCVSKLSWGSSLWIPIPWEGSSLWAKTSIWSVSSASSKSSNRLFSWSSAVCPNSVSQPFGAETFKRLHSYCSKKLPWCRCQLAPASNHCSRLSAKSGLKTCSDRK